MAYEVRKASGTTAETALSKQNHLWSFKKEKPPLPENLSFCASTSGDPSSFKKKQIILIESITTKNEKK
jgi:hypothetical protein